MSQVNWYAIKTIYQITASGKPKNMDRSYLKSSVMVEERVVLFKAKNELNAIKKAEKEAREYAEDTHVNPYGQEVKIEYIGYGTVFNLFDEPSDGVEVYASTEIHESKPTKKNLIDAKLGKIHGRREGKLRLKFQNGDFTRVK